MDMNFIFFVLAVFIAVVLLVEGLYVSWSASRGPEAKRVARRLRVMTGGDGEGNGISIRKKRELSGLPALQQLLARLPVSRDIDELLAQAGSQKNVGQFFLLTLAFGAAGLLASFFGLPGWAVLAACALLAALPWLYFRRKRTKRLALIEAQLPEALDLMTRALRAGHALPAAIQMVTTEMNDPIAGEFRIVFDEINFGIPMHDALNNLARRIPGTDVGYFVVAVLIQRETGGDLTELLGNIAAIVRERLKLLGQVRALSAEGRLSAWILSLMPFVLTGIMNLLNPKFMNVLWTDPGGQRIVAGMMVMMVFGILWMRKIIRIRV
ncbi:type II secretion system F family protein [Lacisediminimonas profundi]|uniref:type II secretion system F family protein n=1 Tax=Lacisediminimonas profundi TaxID=2603856 RepID=UPI00124BC1DC|nr:type II secretion system F family protein [Lacisediminimonas profundi]